MAAAGESTQEEEDIEFPAISPAPVLIALLNLVQAIVIWLVAVTVHLPRYLLFSKQRRITIDVKEPTGETRRWCRENPGLRGFVLELQTPSNTFKAYKCNSTEPHIIRNDYVDGKFSFLLATDPPVNNLPNEREDAEMRIQGRFDTADGRPASSARNFLKDRAEYSDEGPGRAPWPLSREGRRPRMVLK